MSFDLIVVGAIFVVSVSIAIGLSLFVITVVLRMQHRHRKRLARVGRKRMSGRLDIDDARLMLLRQKQETNVIVTLTDALARFIPLLDTTRLRANIRRAGLELVGGDLRAASRWRSAAVVAVGGMFLSGYPLYVCVRARPLHRHVPGRPLREVARRHAAPTAS